MSLKRTRDKLWEYDNKIQTSYTYLKTMWKPSEKNIEISHNYCERMLKGRQQYADQIGRKNEQNR